MKGERSLSPRSAVWQWVSRFSLGLCFLTRAMGKLARTTSETSPSFNVLNLVGR